MTRLLCLLLILVPSVASSQITQADLESHLLHKRFILRGMYAGDKLEFDTKGEPVANYRTASFTLSGVQINRVRIQGTKAVIDGERFALRYNGRPPGFEGVRIAKNKSVRITLDFAGVSDCGPALERLFATDGAGLAPTLPEYWKPFFGIKIPRSPQIDTVKINDPGTSKKFDASAVTVVAPVLLQHSEPEYNDEAKAALINGVCTIAFIVDTNGEPRDLSIIRPIGVGLDELAIVAVKKYRFKPAQRDGRPVAVVLKVEVEFKIY